MNAKLHILQKSSRLNPYKKKIQSAFVEVIKKIEHAIELPEVDIVVADNPTATIPETGVGGFCVTPHLICIWIKPDFDNLYKTIQHEIKHTIAHETHHAARSVALSRIKARLIDAFIAEGLADHFDIQINNSKPRPWSVALGKAEIQKYFQKAKTSELFLTKYDHSLWFFGSRRKEIPRWTGYSIGFALVETYMKKTGKKASELVQTPSLSFIKK